MANHLKALRQAQGYSRYAFARALAVTPVTVWRWEQSLELPNGTLKRCAQVLKVAATDIDPELGMLPVIVLEAPNTNPAPVGVEGE